MPEATGEHDLRCTLVDPVPTADGEPLAKWDQPEVERAIETMSIEELHRAMELYNLAIEKLEEFVAATKPPKPPDSVDIVFIQSCEAPASFPSPQALEYPDHSKFEILVNELSMKEPLEKLSLERDWIVKLPSYAENYLGFVLKLRDKALDRRRGLEKTATDE